MNWGSGSNIDLNVSASVGISIPLYSSDGFLGHYKIERSRIGVDSADISMTKGLVSGKGKLANLITGIKQQEATFENTRQQFENEQKVLNSLIEQLGKKELNTATFRNTIKNARDAENTLISTVSAHLKAKLDLCKEMGVSNLPGDTLNEYFE
jgi:hypothetical protein